MMIQLCSTLPENFPVTDDMVKGSLGGSSLEQEMEVRFLATGNDLERLGLVCFGFV